MTHPNDWLWDLVTIVESAAADTNRMHSHAVTCGALEAAGHLMDPGINTLARAHRQGLDVFLMQLDRTTGRRLTPHFNAGFAGLLVAANVPLAQLRAKVEGRQ